MNERELAKALLRYDATMSPEPADPGRQVREVLRRDRRRVRMLTTVTVLLWLMSITAIIFLAVVADVIVFPRMKKLAEEANAPAVQLHDHQRLEAINTLMLAKGTVLLSISVAVLALAAIGTVLLVFMSRRATLRQMNASLIQISEQLKELRGRPGG